MIIIFVLYSMYIYTIGWSEKCSKHTKASPYSCYFIVWSLRNNLVGSDDDGDGEATPYCYYTVVIKFSAVSPADLEPTNIGICMRRGWLWLLHVVCYI